MLKASVFSTAAFHRTVPEDRPTIDERADAVHRGDPRGRRWVAREAGHGMSVRARTAARLRQRRRRKRNFVRRLALSHLWRQRVSASTVRVRARRGGSRARGCFPSGGRRPCGFRAGATLLNEVRVMRGDRGFVLFLMVVLVALTALFYELFPRHGEQGQMGEGASAPAGAPSPPATGK